MKPDAPTATQTGDKRIKDRNPDHIGANASGGRRTYPVCEEHITHRQEGCEACDAEFADVQQRNLARIHRSKGESAHTPTPWRVGKNYHYSNPAVMCKHGEMIAEIYSLANHKCTEGKDMTNINFIARACNNYDELLVACKMALDRLVWLEAADHLRIGWSPAKVACEKVIAKVKKAEAQ